MGALNGYNILDRLNYWRKNGMWGHALWAYAAVDLQQSDLVKFGINEFGALDIGVNLPNAWQDADTWDVGTGRSYIPGSWGGHSVPLIGYDAEYLYVCTWGSIVSMTWPALRVYCDEAYVAILPDWIAKDQKSPSGFDLPALHNDLFSIV
jgi:hypothetical protein